LLDDITNNRLYDKEFVKEREHLDDINFYFAGDHEIQEGE